MFVHGPPKGFEVVAINGTLCFTDMAVDSLGRLWVGYVVSVYIKTTGINASVDLSCSKDVPVLVLTLHKH